jgi:predicted RNA-binding Zn ribbon-like protein
VARELPEPQDTIGKKGMMSTRHDLTQIQLIGGDLSLDFVNSVHDRFEEPAEDYLGDFADLATWALVAGGISSEEKRRLENLARNNAQEAERVYAEALQLREAIHALYVSLLEGTEVPGRDLERVNRWLSGSMANLVLEPRGERFEFAWSEANYGLESVLWPLTRSIAALVTSDRVDRLKQCPACGWLFLDSSKNMSRRWCSMETCGNRAKARRFYQQSKS